MELAALQHLLHVERFHPLYPAAIDRKLVPAARVEARLRRIPDA